ncbi:MAG: hypothetical protein JWP46_1375, partial [Modestobacter sp.]|nr:hypothetical protein [Modestobacter sp.]
AGPDPRGRGPADGAVRARPGSGADRDADTRSGPVDDVRRGTHDGIGDHGQPGPAPIGPGSPRREGAPAAALR